jgi:hypothetical protein
MLSDANFLRRFVDLLEVLVKKCDSVGGSAPVEFLLRARKQVDKLGLLGCCSSTFSEGAVDSKDIAARVLGEPARSFPRYRDQTVSSSRFRGEMSLSRFHHRTRALKGGIRKKAANTNSPKAAHATRNPGPDLPLGS